MLKAKNKASCRVCRVLRGTPYCGHNLVCLALLGTTYKSTVYAATLSGALDLHPRVIPQFVVRSTRGDPQASRRPHVDRSVVALELFESPRAR